MNPRENLQQEHPWLTEDEEENVVYDANMVIRHTEGTFALVLVEGEYYEGPY